MNIKNSSFCSNRNCIHRRGCIRFLGNYKKNDLIKIMDKNKAELRTENTEDYSCLKRFRNSNISGNISLSFLANKGLITL